MLITELCDAGPAASVSSKRVPLTRIEGHRAVRLEKVEFQRIFYLDERYTAPT